MKFKIVDISNFAVNIPSRYHADGAPLNLSHTYPMLYLGSYFWRDTNQCNCPLTIKTEKWRRIKKIEHNQRYTLVRPRYRAYRVFIFISFAVLRACRTWLTCGVLLFGFLCCYSLILGAWLSGIQGRQRLFVLSRTIRLRCPIRSRPVKRIENIETRQPSFHRDIDPQNYTPQIKTILKNKATIYILTHSSSWCALKKLFLMLISMTHIYVGPPMLWWWSY